MKGRRPRERQLSRPKHGDLDCRSELIEPGAAALETYGGSRGTTCVCAWAGTSVVVVVPPPANVGGKPSRYSGD